jgi:8-oxo-dGTP pyrophosphatase MutT (NUDIX family)
MIKIFTLHQTLFLTNTAITTKNGNNCVHKEINSQKELELQYNKLISDQTIKEIYFYNRNLDFLLELFKKMFKIIEAAGGLVSNSKNEYLFIKRNGKWDLPKGKIEKKEKIEDAALREVEEECGVSDLKIIKPLVTTYHTYFLEEQPVLKPTYWFLMHTNYSKVLTPQQEEGITEVKWIAKKDFGMVLENTYESIKDVLQKISES